MKSRTLALTVVTTKDILLSGYEGKTMTRQEHLNWAKQRAFEYLQPGKFFSIDDAMASIVSDLGKHDETRHHVTMTCPLMFQLRASGHLSTADEMRKFIEGFN